MSSLYLKHLVCRHVVGMSRPFGRPPGGELKSSHGLLLVVVAFAQTTMPLPPSNGRITIDRDVVGPFAATATTHGDAAKACTDEPFMCNRMVVSCRDIARNDVKSALAAAVDGNEALAVRQPRRPSACRCPIDRTHRRCVEIAGAHLSLAL